MREKAHKQMATYNNISKGLLKLRNIGKKKDYELLIKEADDQLNYLCSISSSLEYDDLAFVEATILGYKGYAEMTLKNYSSAISQLQRSFELKTASKKLVANMNNESVDCKTIKFRNRNSLHEELIVEECLAKCCKILSVSPPPPPLCKYSRTSHLFHTGGTAVSSDDLVLTKDEMTLFESQKEVIIEEKVDGANFALSLCSDGSTVMAQNRSKYISSGDHAQFGPVDSWIEENHNSIREILTSAGERNATQGLILYGEWVVAKHSIPYDRLPGYFIAFDIYDRKEKRFYSRKRFHEVMFGTGIPVVPTIAVLDTSIFKSDKSRIELYLKELLNTSSQFRSDGGFVEGIVLRVDEEEHDRGARWLQDKVKLVRPDFVAGCSEGHWSRRDIEKNRIDFSFTEQYLASCYRHVDTSDEAMNGEYTSIQNESNLKLSSHDDNTEEIKVEKEIQSKAEKKAEKEEQARRAKLRRRAPKYVILAGLPCSGKSTFADTFCNRSRASEGNRKQEEWIVVNQDKLGKKACVELASKCATKGRVIIDRCNPGVGDRQFWLDIFHNPPKSQAALIYFATDLDTCIERAKHRKGHETIPEGKGERIIRDVSKIIQPPTPDEKNKFGTIAVIQSSDDVRALLKEWGV